MNAASASATSYSQIVHRIFSQNMFKHKGLARNAPQNIRAELSLDCMARLTAEFGDPQNAFRAVHIAGTNGKGSVALKTATGLQYCGYRTGLFTSPHINSFCERIQVNQQCISEEKVVEHASRIFEVIESKQISVTFFEIVTMLALLEFREQAVDFAVLECGLGGRLDATNVIKENIACTAVTSIGKDHEDILGSDLADIATEKAGIIKTGVQGCVLGPTAAPFDVFRQKYIQAGAPMANLIKVSDKMTEEIKSDDLPIKTKSFHQINSEVSRHVLQIALQKTPEELEQMIPMTVLENATPPCRLEQVQNDSLQRKNVQVYLDVCHNEQGVTHVFNELSQQNPNKPISLVFGASIGKKVGNLLQAIEPFSSSLSSVHCVQNLDHFRLQTTDQIIQAFNDYSSTQQSQLPQMETVENIGQPSNVAKTVNCVLEASQQDSIVLICGSFFFMADAKQAVQQFQLQYELKN